MLDDLLPQLQQAVPVRPLSHIQVQHLSDNEQTEQRAVVWCSLTGPCNIRRSLNTRAIHSHCAAAAALQSAHTRAFINYFQCFHFTHKPGSGSG